MRGYYTCQFVYKDEHVGNDWTLMPNAAGYRPTKLKIQEEVGALFPR